MRVARLVPASPLQHQGRVMKNTTKVNIVAFAIGVRNVRW